MDNVESMKEYLARAKSLVLNLKYHGIEITEQEISRRVLDGLPPAYAFEKRNFALKTDFSSSDLEGGLVHVEELNRSLDGTDGSHTLVAGFKARSGGQSGRSCVRSERDGKGRPQNQRQPQHQSQQQQYHPRHQQEQPAH